VCGLQLYRCVLVGNRKGASCFLGAEFFRAEASRAIAEIAFLAEWALLAKGRLFAERRLVAELALFGEGG